MRFLANYIVGKSAPHLPVVETREGDDIPTVTKALAEWLLAEAVDTDLSVRWHPRGQIIVGENAIDGITVIVREYPGTE